MGNSGDGSSLNAILIDPEGRERSATLQWPDGVISIGRAPENDIQVVSPYISRRHAEVRRHPDGAQFRDLRSTSGSYIAGRRISEAFLRPGDAVRLGSPDGIRLVVQEPDAPSLLSTASADTAPEDEPPGPTGHTEVIQVAALDSSPYLTGLVKAPAHDLLDKRKPEDSDHTAERLLALIALTQALLGVDSKAELADQLLQSLMDLLPVERGMVLLHDGEALSPIRWLERGETGGDGLSDPMMSMSMEIDIIDGDLDDEPTNDPPGPGDNPNIPFHPIRTVTDRVFDEGIGLLTLDALSDQRLEGSKSVFLQSVRSILAAPISTGSEVAGVLYLDTRRPLRKNDGDALDFLMAVARQAGMVLRQLDLVEQQKRMVESMMRALAASIDARDGMTAGHSARVAHYSVGIARAYGLGGQDLYAIYYAALLHDYGKIGVDDAVLKKPARLTPDEYKHIQLHPKYSYDILSKIEFPPGLKELPMMAATHHERMDGAGYPFGMAGDEIPIAGRIMAIADVYDSLTRKRHYRDPMPLDEVLEHLEEGRGDRFDPQVLDAFFSYHNAELADREARRTAKRDRAPEHTAPQAAFTDESRPTNEALEGSVPRHGGAALVSTDLAPLPDEDEAPRVATVRQDGGA
jgi:response regulator RpfG family c-di-GMP phosphodiesterase